MLKDIIVVELASVLAGPAVGMFFAEQGATVYKIENPKTGGDVTRSWKTPAESPDLPVSAYYCSVNWGKKSLFYNLSDKEDREKAYTLIKSADIVITNYKKGDAEKLGMDFKTLKGINEKMIYAHISGFGADDDRVAYDVVLQAETGFMSMNGTSQSGPLKMPVALIDILAAHQLKEGVLLALYKRLKTGEGSFVSVSLYEAAIASLANQASNWLMNKEIPSLSGSLHPNIAPYGEVFLTKDILPVVLAIGTDSQFKSLCSIIGIPELAEREQFQSNVLRVKFRKKLYRILKPYFRRFNRDELLSALIEHKIPAGAIKNLKEVFETDMARNLILSESCGSVSLRTVKASIFNIKNS